MEPARVDELIALLVQKNVYINPVLEHEHKAFTSWAARHQQEDLLLLERPELSYVPLDAKLGMLSMYHRARNYADRHGENFPRLERLSSADQEEYGLGRGRQRGPWARPSPGWGWLQTTAASSSTST